MHTLIDLLIVLFQLLRHLSLAAKGYPQWFHSLQKMLMFGLFKVLKKLCLPHYQLINGCYGIPCCVQCALLILLRDTQTKFAKL